SIVFVSEMDSVSPPPNIRAVTLQLTRDGEQTPGVKLAFLLKNQDLSIQAVFRASDGVQALNTFLASSVDNKEWLLLAEDEELPRLTASRAPVFTQDVTLALDLNDGTGTSGGTPATIQAVVRVEGERADRNIVIVEQQADGAFRLAGYGRAGGDGGDIVELKITPSGAVYALGLDDWGIAFEANRAVIVGETVRPSAYSGWVYRITEPGTLPTTEPTWWAGSDESDTRPIGTARGYAVRY
ncbi:hypothetical protein, partial [Pseudomonas sp. LRF_L74]|uniref:hypothetical protein n=1 Tax=Pseudomonas sp. LRF_L74 TaxID=3369422 RepID=UPI003F60A094